MTDAPAPMTPPECDLRGMPYIPLDIARLFDSDLYALSTGDEFKAALTFWCKAFLQVPAGSLPRDERVLAHLSGAGSRWPKVRKMALHGWVLCSDGRLYHPVVAEKALEAWEARLARRARTEAARQARLARSVTENATGNVTSPATDNVTSSKGSTSKGKGRVKGSAPPPYSPPPSRGGDVTDPAKRPAKTSKGSPLPDDWQPGPAECDFALGLGLDAAVIAAEFRDYWHAVPGQRGRKLDWPATFRNRCRQHANKRDGPKLNGHRPARNGAIQLMIEARERAAANGSLLTDSLPDD